MRLLNIGRVLVLAGLVVVSVAAWELSTVRAGVLVAGMYYLAAGATLCLLHVWRELGLFLAGGFSVGCGFGMVCAAEGFLWSGEGGYLTGAVGLLFGAVGTGLSSLPPSVVVRLGLPHVEPGDGPED